MACEHAWEHVGDTTYSGDTWQQGARVLYCPHCRRYATRTVLFLDFARRPQAEVRRLVERETAERKALLAAHRASVATLAGETTQEGIER